MEEKSQIRCPYCGYRMPVFYGGRACSRDVWVKCKNKKCKKVFEIKIERRVPS